MDTIDHSKINGRAMWITPCGAIYGVGYHPDINEHPDHPDLKELWKSRDSTDDFMEALFRKGWIRFRAYGYGVHINGCSLKKPHKRAHIHRILLYCLDHERDRVQRDTKVTLLNSQEGCYGPKYEPDAKYTVDKLLGG